MRPSRRPRIFSSPFSVNRARSPVHSQPSLITSAIFAFYWSWQEFLGPLIYLSKPRLYPVSIALKMFSDPSTQTNWSGLFAMTTLSIVPVLLVFMFFQKYLVEGVATTGLKG